MKRYLIANWKMKLSESESVALATRMAELISPAVEEAGDSLEVVLCPSHLSMRAVKEALEGSGIRLGGQDVFWEDYGAFTGEISPATLKELGCDYCIVGHSERRGNLGETNDMVHRKADALLRHDINPIICVGETKKEREEGRRDAVVTEQVRIAVEGLHPVGAQRIIIAYEPVWVIGSGRAVEPQDAAEVHSLIRDVLSETLSDDTVSHNCFVIYGGSVDSTNLAGFLEVPIIEGSLVGGASLKAEEFAALARITADLK